MTAWTPTLAPDRTARSAIARPNHAGRRHPIGVARQVKSQRRGYARAVLRGLASTHQGRPAAAVDKLLRQALTPLGVRLSPAQSIQLARQIEAGQPVELP